MTTGQPGQNPEDTATGGHVPDVEGEGESGQPAPETYFVGGRQQTVDEMIRNYEASRVESERWKAIAEERARAERTPANPAASGPEPLPPWASEYTSLGVPENVVRQQVSWFQERIAEEAEARAASKMSELVEGLAQVSTAEGKADAILSREIEGYEKAKVDAFLSANEQARQRYERVYKADPESAKRLAWAELSGVAAPKGQSRHASVPAGRRPVTPTKKEDLADLARRASSGQDEKATADYVRALMGHKPA